MEQIPARRVCRSSAYVHAVDRHSCWHGSMTEVFACPGAACASKQSLTAGRKVWTVRQWLTSAHYIASCAALTARRDSTMEERTNDGGIQHSWRDSTEMEGTNDVEGAVTRKKAPALLVSKHHRCCERSQVLYRMSDLRVTNHEPEPEVKGTRIQYK